MSIVELWVRQSALVVRLALRFGDISVQAVLYPIDPSPFVWIHELGGSRGPRADKKYGTLQA